MKINFTHPTPADLPELVNVENSGFTPEEAATPTSLAERITQLMIHSSSPKIAKTKFSAMSLAPPLPNAT